MIRPLNSIGSFTEEDFTTLYPNKKLKKAALNYLLNLLVSPNKDPHTNHSEFHIQPGIYIHDPTGTDDTATQSPQGNVTAFNSSRYQLLPYFENHHWQLAIFNMKNHIIFRYDSFWSRVRISRFIFLVRSITSLFLVYLYQIRSFSDGLTKAEVIQIPSSLTIIPSRWDISPGKTCDN